MKSLKFKTKLKEKILSGKKTETWRFFDDKDISVGDQVIFIDSDLQEEFATVSVLEVIEKKLSDVSEEEMSGPGFKSLNDMVSNFSKFYGDKINQNSLVKIIKFKLL